MPKVFISYRRTDTEMVAGRLRESLARRLGDTAIFRDKNSIGGGEDWTKAIAANLSGDVVVLALIGSDWATARDETDLNWRMRQADLSHPATGTPGC